MDLVREPFELVPEPLLRHHLPHLAVLEVGRRQVAEVADEPERALLRRRPPVRVHQDLDQADHLLVDEQRGNDQRERRRVARVGDPLDRRPGRDDLRLRSLDHAPQERVVGLRLGAAVHQPGEPELQLMLKLQAAAAVQEPERASRGRHGGHGAVEELDIEFGRLDVRFREVGDLGDQLADLVLCLLEQTGINCFFRHGGSGCWAPDSESPRQSPRRIASISTLDRIPARRLRHTLNGTARCVNFPQVFSPDGP